MAGSELHLWARLSRKALGYRFRRQVVLYGWIADFWCPAAKLVVEVDGPSHEGQEAKDARRDAHLLSHGICTLRYSVQDVYNATDLVIAEISRCVEGRTQKLR